MINIHIRVNIAVRSIGTVISNVKHTLPLRLGHVEFAVTLVQHLFGKSGSKATHHVLCSVNL